MKNLDGTNKSVIFQNTRGRRVALPILEEVTPTAFIVYLSAHSTGRLIIEGDRVLSFNSGKPVFVGRLVN